MRELFHFLSQTTKYKTPPKSWVFPWFWNVWSFQPDLVHLGLTDLLWYCQVVEGVCGGGAWLGLFWVAFWGLLFVGVFFSPQITFRIYTENIPGEILQKYPHQQNRIH